MARKLQENVDRMEEAYFSPAHIRECKYPMNVGRMDDPDAAARVGTVGESIEFHLKFGPDGRVSEAMFNTDGCGSTIASGSMLTQLVKGRSREELGKLTTKDLVEALGGMPPAQMHCVELAVEALRGALGEK